MEQKRFGTFEAVFTPTILSILGVIMYLRLGWIVGQVGLYGALIIVVSSNIITLLTGLSIASITTNIRIGTGGAYSIISKSLGLEVGGAIGMPLYLSQAISVAFYITGFTECWVFIFPQHNFILVSIITWVVLLLISYNSAKLAFRLQYAVLLCIFLSLISIFLGKSYLSSSTVLLKGLHEVGFWNAFAIFFPAVTGILAGVSMSGELKEPQRSIPVGTLSAIIVSFVVYLALAFWYSVDASASELAGNTSIILGICRWRILVIAGIMGATLSSALSMFVASPRTLLALGKHKLIPFSSSFNHINKKGEPSVAILFTALLALVTISMGTLNTIAVILTMFFLITYGTLNISVFIEKIIGITSFRPSFRIPVIFSLLGGIGCFYAMFLINQVFSFTAIAVTVIIYIFLVRRQSRRQWPDVRKGFFLFIAEQAIKIASRLPYHPKIWKPNLLIPVDEAKDWVGNLELIKNITLPRGRVNFFCVNEGSAVDTNKHQAKDKDMAILLKPLEEEGLIVTASVIDADNFFSAAGTVMQALSGEALAPNLLFMKIGSDSQKDRNVKGLIEKAVSTNLGIILLRFHPKVGFGQNENINLWIRRGSPNINLAILIGLQLERNWEGNLRILQAVEDESQKPQALEYLNKLKRIMRLSKETEASVLVAPYEESLSCAPLAGINIFGIPLNYDIGLMRKVSEKINTSVLFLRDSKQEDALV
ncbi:MAG: Na-K-Cl cotransporter [Candidatus Omnitrophica bacterium]|nr:Na-K-Cl cotransporter [Candidatus Omnitrophota bacterium]